MPLPAEAHLRVRKERQHADGVKVEGGGVGGEPG
jgi:hypothetical protein